MSRGKKHFSSNRFGDVSGASPFKARTGASGDGSMTKSTYRTPEEVLQGQVRASVANPLQQIFSTPAIEAAVKNQIQQSVAEEIQRQLDPAIVGNGVQEGVGKVIQDLKDALQELLVVVDGTGTRQPLLRFVLDFKNEIKALHAATLSPARCLAANPDTSQCAFPADRPVNFATGPLTRCYKHGHLDFDYTDARSVGEVIFWDQNGDGVHGDVENFINSYLPGAENLGPTQILRPLLSRRKHSTIQ